jgi:hypothetical protein
VPLLGVVTAGHCDNASTLGGLALTFKAEKWSGSNDEQWYSTPNHTDLKVFFDGSSNRPVYGITARANQAINAYLSKYGKTLGYRCGYLASKSFQPSWVPHAAATFHRAEPRGGPDMTSEGDSGGPVFNSNYALGYRLWAVRSSVVDSRPRVHPSRLRSKRTRDLDLPSMKVERVSSVRRLSLAYALILGAVVSALLVWPIGVGGTAAWGAWLYIALVIAVVTFGIDRLLRIPFVRWSAPAASFVLIIPLAAGALGIIAGWLAATNTMGGPV